MTFRFLFIALFSILTFYSNAQTFPLPAGVEELTARWKKQELKDYLKVVLSNVVALQDAHREEIDALNAEHARATEQLSLEHSGDLEALNAEHARAIERLSLEHARELEALQLTIETLRSETEAKRQDSLMMNGQIIALMDSIAILDSLISSFPTSTTSSTSGPDFLNDFVQTQNLPATLVNLNLSLEHIMLLHDFQPNYEGKMSFVLKENNFSVGYGPEIIDPNDIQFFSADFSAFSKYNDWQNTCDEDDCQRDYYCGKWELNLNQSSTVLKEFKSLSMSDFEKYFPSLEIINGKFLTFKGGNIPSYSLRDFVLTTKSTSHYGKPKYHWQLANGTVGNGCDDRTFDLYEYDGEFYLAMDMRQLMKLGFWVISPKYGVIPSYSRNFNHNSNDFLSSDHYYQNWRFQANFQAKEEILPTILFQRKNAGNLQYSMIEPMSMIFLFKLN